jgi:hypothetical protein
MSEETTVTGPEPEPVVAATGIDDLLDGPLVEPNPAEDGDAGGPDDDLDDEFELPPARGRMPRITALLLAGVLVAVGFAGGAYVQRTHGASATAGTGFPNFGSGGPPSFGGSLPGSGGSSQDGGSSSDRSNVIGTVVRASANSVTVKDFGGTTHVVRIKASTQVSKSQQIDPSELKPGATVVVSGQAGADGSITATTITQR